MPVPPSPGESLKHDNCWVMGFGWRKKLKMMPSQGREMGDICSSRLKLVCLHLKVGFIVVLLLVGWLFSSPALFCALLTLTTALLAINSVPHNSSRFKTDQPCLEWEALAWEIPGHFFLLSMSKCILWVWVSSFKFPDDFSGFKLKQLLYQTLRWLLKFVFDCPLFNETRKKSTWTEDQAA